MGQHGAINSIANRIDAGNIGLPVLVGFDLTAIADFDTQLGQAEAANIRLATRGHQNNIAINLVLTVVFAQLIADLGLSFKPLNTLHCRAHDKFYTLLFQDPLKGFLHLCVHSRGDGV